MGFMSKIDEDEELCELKEFIKKETGRTPGFRFWDGDTIEKYRSRLRKIAKDIKEKKQD